MPVLLSKFLKDNIDKCNLSQNAPKILLPLAVTLYLLKISYPLLNYSKSSNNKNICNGNDTSIRVERKLSDDVFQQLITEKSNRKQSPSKKKRTTNKIFGQTLLQSVGAQVDKKFLRSLLKLLRLLIPRVWSYETFLLVLHTMTLMFRSFLSIYVANLEGLMVRNIVQKNRLEFGWNLFHWLCVALPATGVNSLIRFLESHLSVAFRTQLVKHAYKLYFQDQTYYRISNLDGRIENADHCLTDDISAFCSSVAHLYSHISKPLLDLLVSYISIIRLTRQIKSSFMLGSWVGTIVTIVTAHILRVSSPKFGKIVAEEASRKAQLRAYHSRIIANSEEIAFYGGHNVEHNLLQRAYKRVVSQQWYLYAQRLWYVMLEQFLVKYVWSSAGMVIIALPIFLSTKKATDSSSDVSERTQYYVSAKHLLTGLGDASERLMSSYKEIAELAGYTKRVGDMLTVFEDMGKGRFIRGQSGPQKNLKALGIVVEEGFPISRGEVIESTDNTIRVEGVPIITPNGDVVVPSLTMSITPGMHLLITGPNGCGKSSLFRILGGLWPVFKGTLIRPAASSLFYIPQRPYLPMGCLRDQVIYPDSVDDMHSKGLSEVDLDHIMQIVHLNHVVKREGGWEAVADWKDVLSGGEKQRMGMARLFYQRPKFALLDECTSAVSIDVESEIYQAAIDEGVTLLTITHRPSLWKFHSHLLQFNGEGGWVLEPLDTHRHLTLNEEKQRLESQLAGIPQLQTRLEEVCKILGEDVLLHVPTTTIQLSTEPSSASEVEHSD